MLFHHLLADAGGDAYVQRWVLAFDSRARLDEFLAAARQVSARHGALRTALHWQGLPQPVQVVQRRADIPLEELPAQADALDALLRHSDPRRQRLDLGQAPLLRACMSAGPWIVGRPPPAGRLSLYCFPYAGGNPVAFLPWQERLPAWIRVRAVQLPGRAQRLAEAPMHEWPPLIQALADAVAAERAQAFAFFGHSLGALMAFETARACAERGLPLPERLIVSGCAAPSLREPEIGLHQLPEPALIARLREYQGTPDAVLANAELMPQALHDEQKRIAAALKG